MKSRKNIDNNKFILDMSNIQETNELRKKINNCYQLCQLKYIYDLKLIDENLYNKIKNDILKNCTFN